MLLNKLTELYIFFSVPHQSHGVKLRLVPRRFRLQASIMFPQGDVLQDIYSDRLNLHAQVTTIFEDLHIILMLLWRIRASDKFAMSTRDFQEGYFQNSNWVSLHCNVRIRKKSLKQLCNASQQKCFLRTLENLLNNQFEKVQVFKFIHIAMVCINKM